MEKLNLTKCIKKVILFVIILTPIFSLLEVYALISGTLVNQIEALTPSYIKGIKDVCFIAIIILSVIKSIIANKISKYYYIFGIIIYIIILNILFSLLNYQYSTFLLLAGIRWSVSLLLAFFLIGNIDKNILSQISRILLILFVLHFTVQIYQLFFMPPWFGESFWGLAARTPGLFLLPNTSALFSVLVLFFYHFHGDNLIRSVYIYILISLSIILTMSGTGIIVGILFLLVNLVGKKYIRTFLIGIPALPFILIPIMAIFANRGENYVQESFGTRVEIFFENIGKGQIISDQFGIGTNVAVIFQENFGWNSGAFIADSTYASIVANTGIIGIVIFMLLIFYWFVHVYVVNSIELYSFTLIFVLFGATTILPESYPGNLLFALLLAYYFDKNKLFKTHK